jgi:hypothetical protein
MGYFKPIINGDVKKQIGLVFGMEFGMEFWLDNRPILK